MTLVLDASVALAWLFSDEQSKAADGLFRRVYEEGAHVPVLFPIEIANALNVGLRRSRLTLADWQQFQSVIGGLSLTIDAFDFNRVLGDTARLARHYDLSVYDAMYLELAIRRSLPLATLDGRLSGAAVQADVELAITPAASVVTTNPAE